MSPIGVLGLLASSLVVLAVLVAWVDDWYYRRYGARRPPSVLSEADRRAIVEEWVIDR